MANVERKIVETVSYFLTLDDREARTLRDILSHCSSDNGEESSRIWNMIDAFDSAGFGYERSNLIAGSTGIRFHR